MFSHSISILVSRSTSSWLKDGTSAWGGSAHTRAFDTRKAVLGSKSEQTNYTSEVTSIEHCHLKSHLVLFPPPSLFSNSQLGCGHCYALEAHYCCRAGSRTTQLKKCSNMLFEYFERMVSSTGSITSGIASSNTC